MGGTAREEGLSSGRALSPLPGCPWAISASASLAKASPRRPTHVTGRAWLRSFLVKLPVSSPGAGGRAGASRDTAAWWPGPGDLGGRGERLCPPGRGTQRPGHTFRGHGVLLRLQRGDWHPGRWPGRCRSGWSQAGREQGCWALCAQGELLRGWRGDSSDPLTASLAWLRLRPESVRSWEPGAHAHAHPPVVAGHWPGSVRPT